MFCYKCGKQVANGSVFCSFCGERQPVLPDAEASSALTEREELPAEPQGYYEEQTPMQSFIDNVLGKVIGLLILAAFLALIYMMSSSGAVLLQGWSTVMD